MTEIWKDVVGYEGHYKVSNFGRVKSLHRVIHSIRNGKPLTKTFRERILLQSKNIDGYPQLAITLNRRMKSLKVHRLVAIAFIPNTENKPQVNHIDGVKTNNHVSNLEWATNSENGLHAFRLGLKVHKPIRGEKAKGSKLTDEMVRQIRATWKPGVRPYQRDLARQYNVSQSVICDVINRKRWSHI